MMAPLHVCARAPSRCAHARALGWWSSFTSAAKTRPLHPQEAAPPFPPACLSSLHVPALKELLRTRNLAVGGGKLKCMERLLESVRAEVAVMKPAELKMHLGTLGCSTGGRKAALRERLVAAVAPHPPKAAAAPTKDLVKPRTQVKRAAATASAVTSETPVSGASAFTAAPGICPRAPTTFICLSLHAAEKSTPG